MKKVYFVLLVCLLTALTACEKSSSVQPNCTVVGRWIGPLGNTLYEYKDSLQYTIYSTNGQFGTIADAIPNPHKWWMEGDSLCVKISGSTIVKSYVEFGCNCNLMKLTTTSVGGTYTGNFWKEGADSTNCP